MIGSVVEFVGNVIVYGLLVRTVTPADGETLIPNPVIPGALIEYALVPPGGAITWGVTVKVGYAGEVT